ncbi:helix-turn-helix transcriptional regulator [Ruminococcaceae bacterium OttesenSCG-928-D13]|nr:helix-turn-helix transcriptional regulator [Ruminococcaceae bacterium OttesenSCG-928-D13]
MKKLKQAYEAKGYTGRQFAKSVGIMAPTLSHINKGLVNPVPSTFKKMLVELDCPADDVVMPGEFDYGLTPSKPIQKRKDAHKPKFSPRLEPGTFTRLEQRRAELRMTQSQFIEYLLDVESGRKRGVA